MAESFDHYTARLLSYVGSDDPVDVLSTTPERIGHLMAGLSDEHLRWSPPPGRWSIADIVTHLADAEIVGAYRFRMVLASPGSPLQAYDQNDWARELEYRASDPFVAFEMFRGLRVGLLDLIHRVPDDRFDRYGIHAERGRESVRHLLRLYAGHDRNHLRQIEELKSRVAEQKSEHP